MKLLPSFLKFKPPTLHILFSMFSFFAEYILLSNIHQISPLDCQLPGGRVTVSLAQSSTISTRRSAGSWQVLLTGTTVFHTETLFTSVRSNEEIMLLEQDCKKLNFLIKNMDKMSMLEERTST